MTLFEIIILALIQGITEFLPISSSGHLLLPAELFGWDKVWPLMLLCMLAVCLPSCCIFVMK